MKTNNEWNQLLSLIKSQYQLLRRIEATLKEMNKKLGIIAESSPPASSTGRQKDRIKMLTRALYLLSDEPEPELKIPPTLTHKKARRWIIRLKSEIRVAQANFKNREEEE